MDEITVIPGQEAGHYSVRVVLIVPSFLWPCRAKVGYGILSDIQNWYLFKRDQTGCLYISVDFKWNDKELPLPAAVTKGISVTG